MGRKKRHNFLSVFYLNGFVGLNNKPYVWVYEKDGSDVKQLTSSYIAVEKHFYSFTTSQGEDSERKNSVSLIVHFRFIIECTVKENLIFQALTPGFFYFSKILK